MKKLTFLFLFVPIIASSQIYISSNGHCSFHSATPVEDIDAMTESLNSVFNAKTNEIQFKVAMTSFKFEKALMREHFNEKYVESEKYPYAHFKGKILEKTDLTQDTTYSITAEGILNIHGVEHPYKESGKLTVKNGNVTIESSFRVALKDHKITIPKIVMANISEVIEVRMNCAYQPYKKSK